MFRREFKATNNLLINAIDVWCSTYLSNTQDWTRWCQVNDENPPEICPRDDAVRRCRRISGCAGGDREAPAGAHRPPRPLRLERAPHHPRPAVSPPSHTSAQENFIIGDYCWWHRQLMTYDVSAANEKIAITCYVVTIAPDIDILRFI